MFGEEKHCHYEISSTDHKVQQIFLMCHCKGAINKGLSNHFHRISRKQQFLIIIKIKC